MTPKFLSLALSGLMIVQTYAAPVNAATLTKASVVRTAENANPAAITLSRDIYRTEDYQDNYTVDVPYQDTETYYEDVPYQDYESYLDTEEYWDRERVCRTETQYEDSCHDVRKCEPKFERRCERKKVCSLNISPAMNFAMALFGSEVSRAESIGDVSRREERERGEREKREREQRERGERERGERERRDREERDKRDRENRERETRDRENRERGERERREREDRERGERERGERERREREERDRRDREERGRREREERDRREREERERRCNQEVCENVKVGETCRNERECRRIPHPVQKCEDVQVRKTRTVTKYRWVTKYRQEQRTRTVTRHRTESRCCVTRQRDVFDHQFTANVEVRFPQEATLIGTESEKFAVDLIGSDSDASIRITPVSSIYKYEPQIVRESANKFVINMQLVPTYQPADLGETTLDKFQLNQIGNTVQLNFVDMGNVTKVQTNYEVTLFDNVSGTALAHGTYDPHGQAQVRWNFPVAIAAGTDVRANLHVIRDGIVIAGPVNFSVDKVLKVQAEAKYDITPYTDKNQVGKFSLAGSGKKLVIFFRDLTKDIPQVKSEYTYRLSVMEKGAPRVLAEKTFLREHLTVDVEGRIPLTAAQAFELSETDLAVLTSGKTILIEGQVVRYGTKFPNGSFAIPKKVTLEIE